MIYGIPDRSLCFQSGRQESAQLVDENEVCISEIPLLLLRKEEKKGHARYGE